MLIVDLTVEDWEVTRRDRESEAQRESERERERGGRVRHKQREREKASENIQWTTRSDICSDDNAEHNGE